MKKALTYLFIVSLLIISFSGCKSDDYEEALALQEAGEYESALSIFTELGDYEDSVDRRDQCQTELDNMNVYEQAIGLLDQKDYESAAALFGSLGNYKDSADKYAECESAIEAIRAYQVEKSKFDEKNTELANIISECELLVADGAVALDDSLLPALETSISEAKTAKLDFPDLPEDISDVESLIASMQKTDYSSYIENMNINRSAYEKSVEQYQLVYAPSEAYVISCLKTVPNIVDISAVTEDNDPNGKLNKSGGYTAQVYFSSDLIDQSLVFGESVIEKGTDCGGSIEVYLSPEDAVKREEYLAAFDGGIFSSGSHTVIGTVLIRTSDKLTASQQKQMEQNIIMALTNIEE